MDKNNMNFTPKWVKNAITIFHLVMMILIYGFLALTLTGDHLGIIAVAFGIAFVYTKSNKEKIIKIINALDKTFG